MQKEEYELPITCNKDPKIISREYDDDSSPFSCGEKLLILFFNLMMLFYRIIYFHSFQWLIFFFVYLNVKHGRFSQEEGTMEEIIWTFARLRYRPWSRQESLSRGFIQKNQINE